MRTRRLLAFAIDYLVILTWIALITGVGFLARSWMQVPLGSSVDDAAKLWGTL